MLAAIRSNTGFTRARATCDECGAETEIPCDHCKSSRSGVNEGQAIRKLCQQQGWTNIGKKLRCPDCEARRKEKTMPKTAATKTAASEPPREPTRAQRREIMDLLKEVYDTDQERYKGTDTDDSIADVLSVMPGWVAQIRGEFFGPAGGNSAIEALTEKLDEWGTQLAQQLKDNADANQVIRKNMAKQQEFSEELAKIRKALGARTKAAAGL